MSACAKFAAPTEKNASTANIKAFRSLVTGCKLVIVCSIVFVKWVNARQIFVASISLRQTHSRKLRSLPVLTKTGGIHNISITTWLSPDCSTFLRRFHIGFNKIWRSSNSGKPDIKAFVHISSSEIKEYCGPFLYRPCLLYTSPSPRD